MALTQSALSSKLQTEIAAAINITDATQLQLVCDAIAKAVVDEFQANGTAVIPGHAPGGAVVGTIN